jgi:hypothetical protein
MSHGWTYAAVRSAIEAGRLIRPHRGVLDVPLDDARTETRDLHVGRLRAALLVVADDAVVSHDSAAAVHRQWLPGPLCSTVHLTQPGEPGRLAHDMRIHRSRLPAGLVTVVDGIPVTTIARTAVDVARGHRLPEALLVLDGAARRLAVDRFGVDEANLRDRRQRASLHAPVVGLLTAAYDSVRAWPGSVVVREALALVDLASESPLESRSRGWMVLEGLPRPELAYEVRGRSGTRYFADFAWPRLRVLGEADGSGKYGADADGVTAALRRERRRQRDLEDAGWTFVRWDSTEGRRQVCARLGRVLLA